MRGLEGGSEGAGEGEGPGGVRGRPTGRDQRKYSRLNKAGRRGGRDIISAGSEHQQALQSAADAQLTGIGIGRPGLESARFFSDFTSMAALA